MQVKNKLTGATTNVANDDASIHALIKLGIVEIVPPAAPDFSIKWSVGYRDAHDDHYQGTGVPAGKILMIVLHKPQCSETVWYTRTPKDAKATFKSMGFDLPAEILAEYTKRWGKDRVSQQQEYQHKRNAQGILIGD